MNSRSVPLSQAIPDQQLDVEPLSLEKQLQSQLADTRIERLIQRAEAPFRAELRKVARGNAFVEVHAIENVEELGPELQPVPLGEDRKSTRLNSSHLGISYAVFCLKK